MLASFPFSLLVGAVLGFLAGLGIGGGSLLILWLSAVLSFEQNEARIINLLFFLPSAIISTFFRSKKGEISLKKLYPAIVAGCLSAAVSALFGTRISTVTLKKLFGILLIFTGIREITVKEKQEKV